MTSSFNTVAPEEHEFNFNGFRYVAQVWGQGSKQPLIALHGWLDNSASFEVMAPILVDEQFGIDGVQIVAPDLAGHGHSDHRNGFSDYPVWSEVMSIFAMADEMGWQSFSLLGHSRGAMIALMAAAVFPERISNLILIDAIAPSPVMAVQTPEHMLKSMQDMQRRLQRKTSLYPSYDAAIQARVNSDITKVNETTAKRLAVRGLSELEEGFHWHSDDKLWAFGHVPLTREQIVSFVEKITAKTLILMATKGFQAFIEDNQSYSCLTQELITLLNASVKHFDDGHYLHMEDSANDVALTISNFMASHLEKENDE